MSRKQTLYMAAAQMMAAAMSAAPADMPDTPKRAQPTPSENRRKCKSCRHYHNNLKTKYSIYHCEVGRYVDSPMSVACEHYEKRKRR